MMEIYTRNSESDFWSVEMEVEQVARVKMREETKQSFQKRFELDFRDKERRRGILLWVEEEVGSSRRKFNETLPRSKQIRRPIIRFCRANGNRLMEV